MIEQTTVGMTIEQWGQLITTLKDIAAKLPLGNYTITGAVDFYWIVVLAIALSGWLGYIWRDLKAGQERGERLLIQEMKEEKMERKEQDDLIWKSLEKCQAECLHRRKDD